MKCVCGLNERVYTLAAVVARRPPEPTLTGKFLFGPRRFGGDSLMSKGSTVLLQVCLSIGPTFLAQAIDDNRLLTSVDALGKLFVPTGKGVQRCSE